MMRILPVLAVVAVAAAIVSSFAQEKRDPLSFVDSRLGPLGPENPCNSPGFASFQGLEGWPPEDREIISVAAGIAVESTGLPPCEARVDYLDPPFWVDVRLFRIEHGSCWSLTAQVVGVVDNQAFLLTGDLSRLSDDNKLSSTAAEALSNFNRLTAAQEIEIRDEEDAQEYLSFFLEVYLQRAGGYVPSKDVADSIGRLKFDSSKSELLRQGMKQIVRPVVEVLKAHHGGFRARSYNWYWWYGGLRRFDLEVGSRGQVTFRQVQYAQQD